LPPPIAGSNITEVADHPVCLRRPDGTGFMGEGEVLRCALPRLLKA